MARRNVCSVLLTGALALVLADGLVAQAYQISGSVRTSDLAPLAGVYISAEGLSLGALTNATGNYMLVLPSSSGRLIYSLPGLSDTGDLNEVEGFATSVMNVLP